MSSEWKPGDITQGSASHRLFVCLGDNKFMVIRAGDEMRSDAGANQPGYFVKMGNPNMTLYHGPLTDEEQARAFRAVLIGE